MSMISSQTPDRDSYIAGLRQLADWLEQNPDAPTPPVERILVPLATSEAVEEFADAHSLTVSVAESGNASVGIEFGSIVYHVYGYADFAQHVAKAEERDARRWANKSGMVIEPRSTQGGAA